MHEACNLVAGVSTDVAVRDSHDREPTGVKFCTRVHNVVALDMALSRNVAVGLADVSTL